MVDNLFSVGREGQWQDHIRGMRPEELPGVWGDCHEAHALALAAPETNRRIGVHQRHQDPVGQDEFLGPPGALECADQLPGRRIQHADRGRSPERDVHPVASRDQQAVGLGRADLLAAFSPCPFCQRVPPELNAVMCIARDQPPRPGTGGEVRVVKNEEDASPCRDQAAGLRPPIPPWRRLPLKEPRRANPLVFADSVACGVVP